MTTLSTVIATLRQQFPLLRDQYAVETLGIFGSYVRQQQRPESDIDLLVTFRSTPSLITFLELENYLSDTLGVQVDLVMATALKPTIRERIHNEVVAI